MNKGLQINLNKRQKKFKKMLVIKDEQEDVCRFVTAKHQIIKKVNGKWKHTSQQIINGLQIRNRIYLPNGKYKMVNAKSITIHKKYNEIPEWATTDLIDKYKEFMIKNTNE